MAAREAAGVIGQYDPCDSSAAIGVGSAFIGACMAFRRPHLSSPASSYFVNDPRSIPVRHAFIAALVAATAFGSAVAQDSKNTPVKAADPAKAACTPAPKDLVKKDLAPGEGDKIIGFKTPIWVAYTGWLYDPCAKDFKGEKFDSSDGRKTPFGFVVGAGKVIKGWDEGIPGMKKGGKRTLIIPSDKAYGPEAAGGGRIPPNSTLVFDVEVVGIMDGPVTQAPAKP